jgi:UPF0755 protein
MSDNRFILVTAVSHLLIISGLAAYFVYQMELNQPMQLAAPEILRVERGDSLTAIGRRLVNEGWIKRSFFFILTGRIRGVAGSLKSGEYELRPGMTPRECLALLVSGKVIQYPLTIPEGWTFKQIMEAVQSHPKLKHTLPDVEAATVMAALGKPGLHPEGWFFPETYLFPADTTDVEFLSRSLTMMEQVLVEEWQRRYPDLPYKAPYEALIMASIIEKETAVPEERAKISGVLVRRLQRGIKLQTDPTVIYAVGEKYDGDITTRHLEIDSPYNTYRHHGLPPTPIAVPGRDSIRAALQPAAGNALYFVAMRDGRHYFSETLEEHNAAVSKYQLRKP